MMGFHREKALKKKPLSCLKTTLTQTRFNSKQRDLPTSYIAIAITHCYMACSSNVQD